MQIVFIVSAIAFLKKAIDFVKYLANYQDGKNGIVTQLATWVLGGLGSALLFTQNFAQHIDLAHTQVGHFSGAAQAAIGVLVSSLGSIWHDFTKSIDQHQTSAVPPLVHDGTSTTNP